jgi:hypothetical protein
MRYLVHARLKPGQAGRLLEAVRSGTLGRGSVAGEEYLDNMRQARVGSDGTVHWVETCFCPVPLQEERPYWEEFFQLIRVRDAHARSRCRDATGNEPWACCHCECTRRLEERLRRKGKSFLQDLEARAPGTAPEKA